MAEDATTDCYNEDEQVSGFYTKIMDNLDVPFKTTVLGVEVTVESVDLTVDGCIVVICARGAVRQVIRLLDLPLPTPLPAAAEWIYAYRNWLS
jgi:hypothetical protein